MALSFIENITTIELSYKINNLDENSFMILSFTFDENLLFNVDIKNILNRTISNSSNIFLFYNELSKIENDLLTIKINYSKENTSEEKNNSLLIFKLIESNSISILEKNKLNLGFTISKKVDQYYYLEVFKGEEGEIMLHNKRLYGELYGFIKSKTGINPYNRTEYITKGEDNQLKFDDNTRKLSFKSNQTEQCEKGCYLLITYSHDNYDLNPRVGFEYTLLARIWDEEKIDSQIINIPFNEYIFGVFEEDSINHHYYSLFIPKNTKSIIIQFEGNYIEGFMGFGKKQLTTLRKLTNTKKINEGENKIYKEITLDDSIDSEYISFAFRIKNFFTKDFSLYYFRILHLKKDENNIIYPLDSNLGNFCTPKKEGNDYFCYCLLKNYYNEFSLNYSISTSNKKGKLTYNYFELINGEIKGYNFTNITSASIEKYSNYLSLAKFKFEDNKISDILSVLSNKKQRIYPQIYSKQMYYFQEVKEFIFNLNHSFRLILNHILGQAIITDFKSILNVNSNFKGKPFIITINEGKGSLSFFPKELIFYIKLQQSNNIKELTHRETLREIVNANKFPIYYYIKNRENKINRMNVNFIIKNRKDKEKNETIFFEIAGYIMTESDFNNKRSLNGEFIDLNNPIKALYDKYFKIGILNINRTINQGNYILIKIDSPSHLIENELIMEILAMSKKDNNYILPVNNYITDIYDSTENKSYQIVIDEEDLENKEIMVEFIPDFNGITISKEKDILMENITDNNGIIQKYRITSFCDDIIFKVKIPQDISYGRYIIKYYFSEEQKEIYYKLNKTFTKKKGNQNNDIIFEFNKIEIINYNMDRGIIFKIFGFLYTDENDIKNEFFNSSNTIQEKILKNHTFIQNDKNFSLYFSNVKSSHKNNYIFKLHLKIVVYKDNSMFNEQFLIYTLIANLEQELKGEFPIIWIIIISSLVLIIIIIIIIFTIGLFKLKKKNTNLKEKVLSTSFASGQIDENIIEKVNSKKDGDNENLFI